MHYLFSHRVRNVRVIAKLEECTQRCGSLYSHCGIPMPQSDIMQMISHFLPVDGVSSCEHAHSSGHSHSHSHCRCRDRKCDASNADRVEISLSENVDPLRI